jgi:glycosyltransferase involved in cell wall biosynthesis
MTLLSRRPPDGGPVPPQNLDEVVCSGWSPLYARKAIEIAAQQRFGLIFCLHVNLMPVAALLKRVYRIPIWLSIHGIDGWAPPRSGLRRRSIRAADFVTSSSRCTRDRFLTWSRIPKDCVEVNNNPVHLDQWGTGPKPELLVERYGLRGKRVLLTVGRMLGGDRFKGHDEILAALPELARRYDDLCWLIVGDGPDRARIEGCVRQCGMEGRVVFAGRVPEEEKRDHYLVADAYALPSRTEGFGIAYLEAAACGLPVLGSLRDGSRDPLCDGELGLLVDPDDPASVLHGLDLLLRKTKRVPPEIERFSFENMAARMQRMFDERFHRARIVA